MRQISKKRYFCTLCKTEVFKETNHYNEIYSPCKKCKNDILICIEDIAINERKSLENSNDFLFKRIHFYSYNLEVEKEYNEYNKLIQHLTGKKYKVFSSLDCNSLKWEYFKKLDCTNLKIYKPNTFKNQYIGEGLRLHDWYERITFNNKLKIGYYLEDK